MGLPGAGRPPIYDDDYHPQAAYELIAKFGANEATIARNFKVERSTINMWRAKHTNFKNKWFEAWDVYYCNQAEKTLIKKATGYRYIEKTEEINPDNKKLTKVTKYHKVAQPDIQALKTLLSNRRADRYQDKQTVEHEGNLVINTVTYAEAQAKNITDESGKAPAQETVNKEDGWPVLKE